MTNSGSDEAMKRSLWQKIKAMKRLTLAKKKSFIASSLLLPSFAYARSDCKLYKLNDAFYHPSPSE